MREPITQRTYWLAEYGEGKLVTEQEADWVELDKKKIKKLGLHLPDGRIIYLEVETPSFQPFQLKVATAQAGNPLTNMQAQLIGMVYNQTGDCRVMAYDYKTDNWFDFYDNVYDFRHEKLGKLNFKLLGIDLPEIITI